MIILRHVTGMVGEEFTQKITGMIINLPLADLNYSVGNFETLMTKVRCAVQLLVDTSNLDFSVVKWMQ